MSSFLILPIVNNLMLATLIDFPPLSRNPNKEEEKPSVFLYLLNRDDKLQEHFGFRLNHDCYIHRHWYRYRYRYRYRHRDTVLLIFNMLP